MEIRAVAQQERLLQLVQPVREPDLYKCTIGGAGVYSLPLMFEEGDINDLPYGLDYMKRAVGTDEQDLQARSPAYNAEKIKAAIMIIHGNQDERVPIEQAEALMKALDKANKPYEYLRLADEAHAYAGEENRVKVFTQLLAFLKKHIGD